MGAIVALALLVVLMAAVKLGVRRVFRGPAATRSQPDEPPEDLPKAKPRPAAAITKPKPTARTNANTRARQRRR